MKKILSYCFIAFTKGLLLYLFLRFVYQIFAFTVTFPFFPEQNMELEISFYMLYGSCLRFGKNIPEISYIVYLFLVLITVIIIILNHLIKKQYLSNITFLLFVPVFFAFNAGKIGTYYYLLFGKDTVYNLGFTLKASIGLLGVVAFMLLFLNYKNLYTKNCTNVTR